RHDSGSRARVRIARSYGSDGAADRGRTGTMLRRSGLFHSGRLEIPVTRNRCPGHSLPHAQRRSRLRLDLELLCGIERPREARGGSARTTDRLGRRRMAHGPIAARRRSTVSLGRRALLAPLLTLACSRGGEPRLPAPLAAPAPPSETSRWIAADVARARAGGAGPPLVVASGVGGAGDTIGGRMEVPSEDCVLVLARGSPSIEDLDVFVYADDGAVLGADDKPSAGGSVVVCPPHPRHVYAFGRIAAGHGMLTV